MDADQRKTEQKHFDTLVDAQGETWWGNRTRAGRMRIERRAQMFVRQLSADEDPLVLEVGAGTGIFSQAVLNLRPALRCVCIDLSPKAAAVMRAWQTKYAHASCLVGDVTTLPFPDDSVDAVVGNAILHHLPLAESLTETRRVLKPGGLFFFSEPNMLNPQIALERNVGMLRRRLQSTPDETAFVRWQIARALRAAGFVSTRVEPFDFLHPLVPGFLAQMVNDLSRGLERVPLLREISGSLLIQARK